MAAYLVALLANSHVGRLTMALATRFVTAKL